MPRPSASEIRQVHLFVTPSLWRLTIYSNRQEYRSAFQQGDVPLTEESLRARAVSSAGLGIADELDGGVVLRSLYWRVSLPERRS
jgi:hypothetical protein